LPGSHHFDGRYADIAAVVERFVTRISAPVRAMK
jgi:type IV secretory pathway VirJ component